MQLACPVIWNYAKKPCIAWGAPSSHGCKHPPDHAGSHVCPCGSVLRKTVDLPNPPKPDMIQERDGIKTYDRKDESDDDTK
jgi:hypothetical protein